MRKSADVEYSSVGGNTVILHVNQMTVNNTPDTPGQYAVGTFTASGQAR